MLSVIIPTLNAQQDLPDALASLMPGVSDGIITEVIISDGGSDDATRLIADDAGARVVSGDKGRGVQLARGADEARGDWLLFLHADTVLASGWAQEVRSFMESGGKAAYFRFGLDDPGWKARVIEAGVRLRCALLRLPYGDQGLLVQKYEYRRIGGFRPLVLMEDVDIVRRIGWGSIAGLNTIAVTSAQRYRRDGFFARAFRNLACLGLYYAGVSPARIARFYG